MWSALEHGLTLWERSQKILTKQHKTLHKSEWISGRNRDRNHRMQTLTHVTGFTHTHTHTHTQIQAASGHSQESKKPTTETKPSNDVNTHTQWQCLETFKIFAKSNRHVYHCIFPAFLLSTNPASAFTPSFLLFSITHLHFHFSIWL